jgi:AraC-like DNA-binding protein
MRMVDLRARLEDWLSLRPVLIHIFEGEVPSLGRHFTAPPGGNYYAWLIQKGEVKIQQKEKTIRAKAGEWLLASPGERRQDFSSDARIVSVQFQMKWPDGCNLFEEGLSLVLDSKEHPSLEREARHLLRIVQNTLPSDPIQIRETPLLLEQYLELQHAGFGFQRAIVGAILKKGLIPSRVGRSDDRLLNLLRQLNHWPLNKKFKEENIQSIVGFSGDHLSRRFKQVYGVTPGSYFESRRRDYTRRQLSCSSIPIKIISGDLGFRSLSDFSAWFKRFHRISPRAYRKSSMEAGYL